jgi:hypothetical protein
VAVCSEPPSCEIDSHSQAEETCGCRADLADYHCLLTLELDPKFFKELGVLFDVVEPLPDTVSSNEKRCAASAVLRVACPVFGEMK